ncbi:sulfatase-like hydrolase/transferase [bacterium]|nr:sulfatase-like hydrolase/transferase [bacterium]
MAERKAFSISSGLNRRNFLKMTGVGAGALAMLGPVGCALRGTKPASFERPNIIFFITDDESWLERSIYGWSKLPTPNFDRVARDGVLFTHGYTSAPSCAPSRASVLAGRNFWELEEGAFIQAWLPAKFPVVPEVLEAGGYHAGHTGKGYGPGVYIPSFPGRSRNAAGDLYNSILIENPEEGISNIDYPANFEQFLDGRAEGQPFWFWVGTIEPHSPVGEDNPEKLAEKYGMTLDKVDVPGFLPDTPGSRRERAKILYEICYADETLGKFLKILEDRGELENTLLIVTGDNGTQIPRSKATPYDWGVHEPLAIMWPARVKPGRTVDDFVSFPDLGVTMIEAAGLPVPESMSGRGILGTLLSDQEGQVDPSRDFIVTGLEWHGEFDPMNRASRMVRDNRYEYIVNYGTGTYYGTVNPAKALPDSEFEKTAATATSGEIVYKHPTHPKMKPFVPLLLETHPPEELYDLEKDPWQVNNVIDDPAYAEIKARLKEKMKAYQIKTGDPRATGNMETFIRTREFVQERKRRGYKD